MTRTRLLNVGLFVLISLSAAGCATTSTSSVGRSPALVAEELLGVDRAFSAASATTDLITGITSMFGPATIMPARPRLVVGRDAIARALREDTANATSRAVWAPIRAGISADGEHGFTLGYMTVTRANGSTVPMKYLSYWIRENGAWRVRTFSRGGRADGDVSLAVRPPVLPRRMVAPRNDSAILDAMADEVWAIEVAFSDDATAQGIVKAFEDFGTEESYNMGGRGAAEWRVGSKSIAQGVGGDGSAPAPTWIPSYAGAASSGDLGYTAGIITFRPAPGSNDPVVLYPYVTVWHRVTGGPWRYIAE